MKLNYAHARDATLEAYEWSFAIRRFIPGKLAQAPEYGPANAFSIPPDIMRVLSVDYNSDDRRSAYSSRTTTRIQSDWIVESGMILTDDDPIFCRGIRRIDDEGIYSGLFVHAFAAKLATLTALTLTQSNSIQQSMAQLYVGFINEAKSRDGQQGRTRRLRNQSLLVARQSGGRW